MIQQETAQEIIEQEMNLTHVSMIRERAKLGRLISIVSTSEKMIIEIGDTGEDYCFDPPKELLIPFLDECERYIKEQIKKANEKAKGELNDVTQKT
jgi:ribosomal 30S subunit maturation factor RimM